MRENGKMEENVKPVPDHRLSRDDTLAICRERSARYINKHLLFLRTLIFSVFSFFFLFYFFISLFSLSYKFLLLPRDSKNL